MRRMLIGGLLLIALVGRGQPDARAVRVDRSFTNSALSGCLRLFTDSTNRLSVQDVRTKRFRPLTDKQPNLGSSALVHWVSFRCSNADDQPKHVVVDLDNIFFDETSFYAMDNGRLLQKFEHVSWHTAPRHRPVASRYYAFPLTLAAKQSVRVFVRMQYKGGIFVCPITLWERSHYQQQYQLYTLIYVVPISVLAILTLLSLLFWVAYRKRILLYYALYTGGILGFSLNIEGFVVQYAAWPVAGPQGWVVCTSLAWIGNLLFTEHYVFRQYTLPHTAWRRYSFGAVLWFISTVLGITLLVPFTGALAFTAVVINCLAPLFVFGWLLLGLRYRLPEARIYVVAVLPVMLCVTLIALGGEGVLPSGDKLYVSLYYAPPVEIIILGFGVIRQFFRERETLLLTVQSAQDELINAQEDERRRLAADLHDDVGTSLVALRGKLTNNQDAEQLLDKIIGDVRTVSHNLMPIELHDLGLADALSEVARRLETMSGIQFLFIRSGEPVALGPSADLILYRLVQELLHNIVRHSQATSAVVQLVYHQTNLNITVEDNGTGFDHRSLNSAPGIGLKNVHSRMEWLGGQLAVDSGPAGTTVRLDIPYPPHTPS
ncbi:sensor histidine kinase [Spirosoma arcticum]